MNDGDVIRMRDYVDLRFNDIKDAISHNERTNSDQIKLAAEELARRLDILNHAHAAAVEVQQTYVPREIFEQYIAEVNKRITVLEKFVWGLTAVIAVFGFVVPIVFRIATNR